MQSERRIRKNNIAVFVINEDVEDIWETLTEIFKTRLYLKV